MQVQQNLEAAAPTRSQPPRKDSDAIRGPRGPLIPEEKRRRVDLGLYANCCQPNQPIAAWPAGARSAGRQQDWATNCLAGFLVSYPEGYPLHLPAGLPSPNPRLYPLVYTHGINPASPATHLFQSADVL